MEEKKKAGVSGLEWFLCITGIIILLSFIAVPPILRIVYSDEETNNIEVDNNEDGSEQESQEPKELKCSKELSGRKEEYIIYETEDKIDLIAITHTRSYDTVTEEIRLQCDNDTAKYQNIEGFYYECTSTETEIITNARITTEILDPNTTIPFSLNYEGGAQNLQLELEQLGFACQGNE